LDWVDLVSFSRVLIALLTLIDTMDFDSPHMT
jgi:hypothetical protein